MIRKTYIQTFVLIFIKISLILLLLFTVKPAKASSDTSFKYSLIPDDRVYIIGGRIQILQTWSYPEGVEVNEPVIPDTFFGFEKIEESDIDIVSDDGFIQKSRILTYTNFDSGYYAIPEQIWAYSEGQTVKSNPLFIQINHDEVDEENPIQPIQKPYDVAFPWLILLPYLLPAWLVIGLLVYLYWYYKIWLPKQKKDDENGVIIKIPAPEYALEKLKALENSQLWQKNEYKAYHSAISEIIREYIERHFHKKALQSTTAEVMQLVEELEVYVNQRNKLLDVLLLADMVKFAKAIPLAEENELSLQVAYSFVKETQDHFINQKEEKDLAETD